MTPKDFHQLIFDMELQLVENFLLPTELRVDPAIVEETYETKVKLKKYKTPVLGTFAIVVDGKPGEFILLGTKEGL